MKCWYLYEETLANMFRKHIQQSWYSTNNTSATEFFLIRNVQNGNLRLFTHALWGKVNIRHLHKLT